MKRLILMFSLVCGVAHGAKPMQCPAIDKSKVDVDGMPFCPADVQTNSAWAVFGCAINQANSFHPPQAAEKKSMQDLLSAFAKNRAEGVKKATTAQLLKAADELNLQACRVTHDREGAKDSYLLVYTKPNVKDYSGAFMMLRETKSSKIVIIGPHDDSDGTFKVTKVAIAKTSTLALFSNGHKRGNIKNAESGRATDFVHTENNLGTLQVEMFGKLFPKQVWLHIHGMKDPDTDLYRSRSQVLASAWEKAVSASTNIKDHNPRFNAYFTVDNEVNSNFYLKAELPARIYGNGDMAVTRIVKEMEKNAFAWDAVEQSADDVLVDPTKPGDADGDDGAGVEITAEPVKEELEKDADDDESTPAALPELPPETAATAKRPPQRVLKGKRDLLCIGVKYSTGEIAAAKPGCDNLAGILKEYWERNSRGLLQINPKGAEPFESGLPGAKGPGGWKQAQKSYTAAVEMIKKTNPKVDYFVVPGIYTGPHAGGKVAHVKSTQAMTAEHETGHLLGLGHAGAFDAKGVLAPYGDTDSTMGRIISKYVTAPQYYYLGWLKDAEIADYDPKVASYDLGKIAEWNGVQTVIVPPTAFKGDKYVFVSSSRCVNQKGAPGCISVHFATGGGSQKIMEVADEGYDDKFTGIHVKKLANLKGKIRVSIDFKPKP